jgi:copper chaperone CopZ
MSRFPIENWFHVPALVCECCVEAIAAALRGLDYAARVEADLTAGTVRVISRYYEMTILKALRDAGYQAEPVLQPLG